MISKIRSLVAVVCILLVFGCSSSGGGSDDPDNPENPGTPENPTNPGGEIASLAGTWEFERTKELYDDDDTTVIGSYLYSWKVIFTREGEFTWFEGQSKEYPGDPDQNRSEYSAVKGVYTSTDGYITLNEEYDAESDAPFSASVPWSEEQGRWGIEYTILDGKLYLGILSRSGEGSGIEGVWTLASSETDDDDIDSDGDEEEMIDCRETVTINADTVRCEYAMYVDGDWVVDPDESWSADYEIVDDDSIDFVYDDGYTYRDTYLVTDKYLYIESRAYPPLAKK